MKHNYRIYTTPIACLPTRQVYISLISFRFVITQSKGSGGKSEGGVRGSSRQLIWRGGLLD